MAGQWIYFPVISSPSAVAQQGFPHRKLDSTRYNHIGVLAENYNKMKFAFAYNSSNQICEISLNTSDQQVTWYWGYNNTTGSQTEQALSYHVWPIDTGTPELTPYNTIEQALYDMGFLKPVKISIPVIWNSQYSQTPYQANFNITIKNSL